LPAEKGTSTRITDRIFSLINVVSLVNAYSRQKLVLCNETSIIAKPEDLGEVLSMTQNLNGVPVFKMQFFNEIFYPCYKLKREPDKNKDGTKEESVTAVTTKDLCDLYKKIRKETINTDNLRKTFLIPLNNYGMIEQEESKINNKQYIYYPIVEPQPTTENISLLSNSSQFDRNLHHSRLLLPKNCTNIPENWLPLEILSFLTYRNGNGKNGLIKLEDIKLFDTDGSEISVNQFCQEYELYNKLGRYVYKPKISNFKTKCIFEMKCLDPNDQKDANSISSGSEFDMKDNNFHEQRIPVPNSQIHLDRFVDQKAN
jgi:hypothetical protein